MAGCVPSWMCPRGAAFLGESRGEQAQGLVLVGRQGGAVAVEVAGDAAAGGARAVTERLYASLSLKLCKGERERQREGEQVPVRVWDKPPEPSDRCFTDRSLCCCIALTFAHRPLLGWSGNGS